MLSRRRRARSAATHFGSQIGSKTVDPRGGGRRGHAFTVRGRISGHDGLEAYGRVQMVSHFVEVARVTICSDAAFRLRWAALEHHRGVQKHSWEVPVRA